MLLQRVMVWAAWVVPALLVVLVAAQPTGAVEVIVADADAPWLRFVATQLPPEDADVSDPAPAPHAAAATAATPS